MNEELNFPINKILGDGDIVSGAMLQREFLESAGVDFEDSLVSILTVKNESIPAMYSTSGEDLRIPLAVVLVAPPFRDMLVRVFPFDGDIKTKLGDDVVLDYPNDNSIFGTYVTSDTLPRDMGRLAAVWNFIDIVTLGLIGEFANILLGEKKSKYPYPMFLLDVVNMRIYSRDPIFIRALTKSVKSVEKEIKLLTKTPVWISTFKSGYLDKWNNFWISVDEEKLDNRNGYYVRRFYVSENVLAYEDIAFIYSETYGKASLYADEMCED